MRDAPDKPDDPNTTGINALRRKLSEIRARQPAVEPRLITEVVRAVLTTVSHELTAKESSLLREVEELGQVIANTKSEIAELRVDDINGHDIPFATDELDAIVEHTAHATDAILESCEMLDDVALTLSGEPAAKLQAATTKIYEACSFQDITGQRITKIVATLKIIESKVAHIVSTFGASVEVARVVPDRGSTDADLLNGPQLPSNAMDQSDIDKLMASFE